MARLGRRGGTLALLLAAAVIALVVPSIPAEAAGGCATPGRDGTATLNGVINTYYPGSGTASGAGAITLGAATGAASPIAIGDLVLVIQMQDAAINATNTGAYGDGVAGDPATGWTALNSAGLYEYAVATSAVPLAGGSLTVSSPLINTYTQAAPTATQGQRDFQVIRVPQYVAATLTAGVTALPFNGSTGGVLAFDVDGALNLNSAAVSVSQSGFRAGLGRQLAGGAGGTGTDYVNLSANPFHAQKGEGIAGTPQYVYNSLAGTTVNNAIDGYPNGSTARGAPGTAGGGGTDPNPTANDQNTGGGGGANGGAGGMGGNSWNSNLAMGGFGGTAFPATAARVTAGAGGGAGTRNNSAGNASSGGSGGGIVMIRTGSVTGTGTVTADGGTGVTPANDGGGGGGAGGSIVVVTQTGALGGLTANAQGGVGTDAWPADAGGAVDYHGPGGGGGGGVVLMTSAPATFNVSGGVNGTTTTTRAAFGATPGAAGTQSIITAGSIPGAGSGASCTSDLTIAKSHTDPFVRGSTGTYALTVSNIGGTATSGTTTVTDTLPAGLTPTAASGAGWTCGIVAQTVTCTSTAVVAFNGSFPVISITVNVLQSAASTVTNTATVSGGGEVNTANDTATDLTNVVSRADIAVAKIASSGTVVVGSNVTFTVTVTNNGPSDATGVQITDPLPVGLTFVSAAPSQGTYTSGTGVWDIGAIASGASVTLALTATVTAAGSLTNTATKTAENETDPVAANNSASVTITGQAPDLTIAKSHVGSFVRGSTGSYSVTVSNIGAAASSGLVTVSDTLPAGLAPSTASGTGWTCGVAGQVVTCTRADALGAGASFPVITIAVTVSQAATTPLVNTATVAGGNEINTANDSASDSTTIVSQADIGVTKISSSGTVTVGSNVTFTITVSNLGPSNATGVQITDLLPAGLTYVSSVPSQGTYTSGTGVWNIGVIGSGTSVTLSLIATVTATGSLTNTATKTAENETDPDLSNDTASVTITGQAPDLTIAKSHIGSFVRGSTGNYSLTVSNIGPVASSGLVTVSDTLPAGLTPSTASGSGWSCGIAGQIVTCTRADALAGGGSYPVITITVAVSQAATSPLTNTATVAGGGETNTANDSASDSTTITSQADIGVAKSASSGSVVVGSNVDFTITVLNIGPSNATGVVVTDLLPAGLTYVSSVPSQGTYTSGTGLWNIGALANGASVTLTLTATVTTAGPHTNTATKTAENETDPNAANDSSSANVNGLLVPDLTIAKSHVDPFVRGTNGTYQLVVNNIGPVPTSGLVTVSDTLPAGLTPSTASGTGWSCGIAGQLVTCTRADALAAGGSYPAIAVVAAVAQSATSPLTNTATVAGGGEVNTANDSASDSTTIVSQADIGVTKIASSGSVTINSNVTFTITATNFGPSNATGVQVTDLLPAGLTYVSSVPSQGTYTSGTGLWNIGAIASGSSVTLSLTARVTATGALINTAAKTAENEPDPNGSNDSSSATVNGQAPDLTIAKSHIDPFVRGTTNTYQLVVSNIGPVSTSGTVTVSDTLPAGLTPSTATGTGWGCGVAAQTVTCTRIDVLVSNASYPAITITVTVLQSAPVSVTNTATVSGGNEVNIANDTASDPTTVMSLADIAINKTASSGTVIIGSNVTFTITASNLGPSNATGVHVTDTMSAGLTFVSAVPSQGTYTSGTGDWNIGAIASGGSATLTLTAMVNAAGALANTATKSAENESDPNSSNDSSTATLNSLAPDVTISKSHIDPFVRGTVGSYNLIVTNIGATATIGLVTVTDTLPAGLTPSVASGTGWACGLAGQTVTCTRADALAAAAAYPTITISVTVLQTAPGAVTNSGTVGGGGEVNTGNDSATDPTTITSLADVAVTKSASAPTVTVGSNVTFTITARNNGPSNATGVQVTDPLPAALTFVAAVPSVGTYTSGTGVWNIGPLASGSSATLTLVATVTQTGSIANTATKTAENETDPNLSNDSSTVTITGQAPDLTITKSHTDPFVRGTTNTYQLVVSNIGTAATSGTVTVADTLPAGLTPSIAAGTGWGCGVAAQTVTCTRSDALASSASYPAITITVTVLQTAPVSVTNTATVSGGNEINAGNDTASDPTNIASLADIGVSKSANGSNFVVGSNVTFTITANNIGPSNATGVHVTDLIPAGLTFVSAVPSQGTYASGTGDWNIGAIASGGSATLTLVATVTQPGAITNTATKSAENESDPNPANDSASVTINGFAPDLTIAKSHVGSFLRGSTGSYSVTVSNIGPVASSGLVTVSDTLPAGLAPSTASGTGWGCGIAGQVVTCTRSDALLGGASYPVITIMVAISQSATTPLTNTATVAGGNEVNTANDSAADATVIASQADVSLTKIASSATVTTGSNVTFTITAHNAGPSDATGVQVTDALPAGLTLVSGTPSTGTFATGTGVWTIGSLASGGSATLTVVAKVTTTGPILNTARKTNQNEPDPNPGNDVSSTTVTGTGLPGPPNGGMAAVAPSPSGGGPSGGLFLGATLVGFLGLLFLRRRSHRLAVVAGMMAFTTLATLLAPAPVLSSPSMATRLTARPSDLELFGKPISTVKPEIGTLASTLHPANGPITPYRIRIPALGIDTLVEPVGTTASGLMDVPGNLWNTAWLRTGVKPGASGQAVIDGHLDSVRGSAIFSDLHQLHPGDRIYVSDADGRELTFSVRALEVLPLDGFPTLRVFGPAHGRLLNLITCAGHFDLARRTYDHRLVVFAELL